MGLNLTQSDSLDTKCRKRRASALSANGQQRLVEEEETPERVDRWVEHGEMTEFPVEISVAPSVCDNSRVVSGCQMFQSGFVSEGRCATPSSVDRSKAGDWSARNACVSAAEDTESDLPSPRNGDFFEASPNSTDAISLPPAICASEKISYTNSTLWSRVRACLFEMSARAGALC